MKLKNLFTIGLLLLVHIQTVGQIDSGSDYENQLITQDLIDCYAFEENIFCVGTNNIKSGNEKESPKKTSDSKKKKQRGKKSEAKKHSSTPDLQTISIDERANCLIGHLYFKYTEEWGLETIIDWKKEVLAETRIDPVIIKVMVNEELVDLQTTDLLLHQDLFVRGEYRCDFPIEKGTIIRSIMIQEQFLNLSDDLLTQSEENCRTVVIQNFNEIYEQTNSQE